MKKFSRPLLIVVLMLVFWTSACNLSRQTPVAPLGTTLSNGQLATPTTTGLISATETSTPLTPVIPITGENVVKMQCQFCVNGFAHAVFVFPDFAIFDVETSSPVTCLTAEVVNGKRVLVCHGTQSTSFNLKICSDNSNCLLFPVALEPCPLAGAPITTATVITTPVFLTPINTLLPPSSTPKPKTPVTSQAPTQTSVVPPLATSTIAPPSLPTSTPIIPPPSTSTPIPPPPEATSTSAPPPPPPATSTAAPPPPTQPADTSAPTSAPFDNNKKPTRTPEP